MIAVCHFDMARFNFRSRVIDAIGDPGTLRWDGGDETTDADQDTPWHAALYRLYDAGDWLETWRRFAVEWVRPRFGCGMAIQARPTWRVHPAGNHRVGPWHRDTRYGHRAGTTNLWIPVTYAHGANALHVEGEAIPVRWGQVLVFDGAMMMHGNVANTTMFSRVSFDARLTPRASLVGGRSVNTGTPLEVGGYYADLDDWAASSLDSGRAARSTP